MLSGNLLWHLDLVYSQLKDRPEQSTYLFTLAFLAVVLQKQDAHDQSKGWQPHQSNSLLWASLCPCWILIILVHSSWREFVPHLNPSHANLSCEKGASASGCTLFLQTTFIKLIPDLGRERGGRQGFGEKVLQTLWILHNIYRISLILNQETCTFKKCLSA